MRIIPLIFAALFAALMPCIALAHAALVSADPAADAVLDAAPPTLTLTFNEPVTPLVFRWITPDGAILDLPAVGVQADNSTLTVTPPNGLGTGTHVLSWRVASPDGHPVGGTLGFSIGSATARAADTLHQSDVPVAVARWALTVALVFGVGGNLFAVVVAGDRAPSATRRIAGFACLMVLPLAMIAVGLHGADMLGTDVASLTTISPWAAVAGAGFAQTAGLAALAAVLALMAGRAQGQVDRWLALAAWGTAAMSFGASGHATTTVKAVAVSIHAASLIFWIGALPGLAASVAGGAAAVPLLRRFSAHAVPMVLLLIGSGIALMLATADSVTAITQTAWGRLLLAKLAIVAAMLLLAALNKQRLTPALARTGARGPLRRSIRAELCLAVLVLALASGFRLTGTPNLAVAAPPSPMVHIHTDKAMATVTLASALRGQNGMTVDLSDGDFGPLDPLAVEASLDLNSAGLEKLRLPLIRDPSGLWMSDPFSLPVAGRWTLTLRLRIDDFTSIALTTEVDIAQ